MTVRDLSLIFIQKVTLLKLLTLRMLKRDAHSIQNTLKYYTTATIPRNRPDAGYKCGAICYCWDNTATVVSGDQLLGEQ